jgi:hypothetical protein
VDRLEGAASRGERTCGLGVETLGRLTTLAILQRLAKALGVPVTALLA